MIRAGCALLMGCLLLIAPLLGLAGGNSLLIPTTSRCVLDTSPESREMALEQCRRFAKGGDVEAQYELGEYFYNAPQGRDVAQALYWYEQASLKGHADAQLRLGTLFWQGEGVPANKVQAYILLKMSAVNGSEEAMDNADQLTTEMNRDELTRANRVLGDIFRNYLQELQSDKLIKPSALSH